MRKYLGVSGILIAAAMSVAPVRASTLTADGITYSLTDQLVNSTTDQFTLSITGINGSSDTEQGRYGVNAFAFTLPSNYSSAIAPAGFTEQPGGLNSGGCNGSGGFFCFAASTTPSGPALAANSSLSLVFDVVLSSGSFAGFDPDFKIDWIGTKNNYDLVSKALPPTAATPLPSTLPLFAGGLGLLGFLLLRKQRSAAAGKTSLAWASGSAAV